MKIFSRLLFSLYFVLFTFWLPAQENLFPNPGFEEYVSCFNSESDDSIYFAKDWSAPTADGVISENQCDENTWQQYLNAKEAYGGSAVQYIMTWFHDSQFSQNDSRRYIVTKLKKPLVKGHRYYFSMYVRCVFNYNIGNFCFSNKQAIAFSSTPPKYAEKATKPIDLKPVFTNEKIIDSTWNKIEGCFTATGNEQYAVIGNFNTKNETQIKRLGVATEFNPFVTGTVIIGSYLVDDVVLLPLSSDFPQDSTICQGESIALNVKKNMTARYKWQDGTNTPQYLITKTGIYTVTITYDALKCTSVQSINVRVLRKGGDEPWAIDTVTCQNQPIILKAGTGYRDESIKWDNNSTDKALKVQNAGTFSVRIENSCGTYLEKFNVSFRDCNIKIYVPNTFSPNGDNLNDTFLPFINTENPIINYEFIVYNRWGIPVFRTNDKNEAWNGTFKGNKLDEGIYIWYLRFESQLNNNVFSTQESGDVMILY